MSRIEAPKAAARTLPATGRMRKRQRAAALQDLSESWCPKHREASWSAAALCRFLPNVRWYLKIPRTGE